MATSVTWEKLLFNPFIFILASCLLKKIFGEQFVERNIFFSFSPNPLFYRYRHIRNPVIDKIAGMIPKKQ
jgi:hypothetical protein